MFLLTENKTKLKDESYFFGALTTANGILFDSVCDVYCNWIQLLTTLIVLTLGWTIPLNSNDIPEHI